MGEGDRLIDLASERVGGVALAASDEFFAPKENLLKPGRGVFLADEYTEHGKWMDGWETRRRREPGHDWCLLRLGIPGIIRTVTVDTNHFRGNHPEACSLEGAEFPEDPTIEMLTTSERWRELLPVSPLQGHTEHQFSVSGSERVTHIRFNIHPDGGVARLRVWGKARPDWSAIAAASQPVDLVAAEHGGRSLESSDQFFSEPSNLIMPGRSSSMKDGWETRRRRDAGHDWVIMALGRRGIASRLVVDTAQFKGNYPESCSVESCDHPSDSEAHLDDAPWSFLLTRTPLGADQEHLFDDLAHSNPITHVRLSIFPDGGVSRFRVFGMPVGEADR